MSHPVGQRVTLLWRRDNCVALAVLFGGWGLWLACAWPRAGAPIGRELPVTPERVARVREWIDPNTASVASLRRLPLVGPEKARAIVECRRAAEASGRRAFQCREDLATVPGIGPVVLRVAGKDIALPSRQGGEGPTPRNGGPQTSATWPASR